MKLGFKFVTKYIGFTVNYSNRKTLAIEVKLFRGKFIVTTYTKDGEKIKASLEEWYREKAIPKMNYFLTGDVQWL